MSLGWSKYQICCSVVMNETMNISKQKKTLFFSEQSGKSAQRKVRIFKYGGVQDNATQEILKENNPVYQ